MLLCIKNKSSYVMDCALRLGQPEGDAFAWNSGSEGSELIYAYQNRDKDRLMRVKRRKRALELQ